MTRTWEGSLCDAGLLTDDILIKLGIAQPPTELKGKLAYQVYTEILGGKAREEREGQNYIQT